MDNYKIIDGGRYAETWSAYRYVRNFALLNTAIGAGLFFWWSEHISDSPWQLSLVLFVWVVGGHFFFKKTKILKYYFNIGQLICPRCHQPFFYYPGTAVHNWLTRKCLNCGLKKFAGPDRKL